MGRPHISKAINPNKTTTTTTTTTTLNKRQPNVQVGANLKRKEGGGGRSEKWIGQNSQGGGASTMTYNPVVRLESDRGE